MSDEQVSLSRAEQALERGEPGEAVRILKRLLQQDADNVEILEKLGPASPDNNSRLIVNNKALI
jgi:predicted Zn-dependent protease